MASAPERELRFGRDDLAAFARASGDANPLHVEPAFARRSPFGSCVVHGCLLTLGMLGCVPPEAQRAARRLTVSFNGPLPVDESAVAVATETDSHWDVRLLGRGKLLARVELSHAPGSMHTTVEGAAPAARPQRATPAEEPPAPGETVAVAWQAGPELAALATRLGAADVPRRLLEGLAWASYVAGMEAPGLHGLLAGVTVAEAEPAAPAARLAVRRLDERTGLLVVDTALPGGTAVTVEAFARAAPRTPDVASLQPAEPSHGSAGAAVVVGASRGLGAALALALALRGYAVHGVYASSSAAADELQAAAGDAAGRLVLHRADAGDAHALEELRAAVAQDGRPLRAIVLAAALPPLPVALAPGAVDALADYVAASVRLAAAPLAALLPELDEEGTVVVCSSTALVAPPRDWPHYVVAKGALEGLAAWVASAHPRASTVVVRLPKLRTDMTNTPAGRLGAVPVEPVARWLADVVVPGGAAAGLTTVEPPAPSAALPQEAPA